MNQRGPPPPPTASRWGGFRGGGFDRSDLVKCADHRFDETRCPEFKAGLPAHVAAISCVCPAQHAQQSGPGRHVVVACHPWTTGRQSFDEVTGHADSSERGPRADADRRAAGQESLLRRQRAVVVIGQGGASTTSGGSASAVDAAPAHREADPSPPPPAGSVAASFASLPRPRPRPPPRRSSPGPAAGLEGGQGVCAAVQAAACRS
jgi:hypothetical protein